MHNKDIQELLNHVRNEIPSISGQSKNGSINKVALKNALENLRSILDYATQDIKNKLQSLSKDKVPGKVYFPYGQRENHFRNSAKRNLPNLSKYIPKIYSLIQSMQSFKCGDSWLVDLCGLTNDVKHNNLSKTENEKSRTIYGGEVPCIEVKEGARVSMIGAQLNGVLQDDVNIERDGITTIRRVSGQTLIVENNKMQFEGKQIEAVPFLEIYHKNLSKFASDLAAEL